MAKKAKWVAFPMKFDEAAGVKWNAEHTRIVSVDYEEFFTGMRKAMPAFLAEIDRRKAEDEDVEN